MQRRDFIKTTIIGTLGTSLLHPENAVSRDVGEEIVYKGYKLHWSGYYYDPASMKLYGSWTGIYKRKELNGYGYNLLFYSSNIGEEGIIPEGSIIPLICKEGQVFPHFENFTEDKDLADKQKLDALNRIKKVVDNREEYGRSYE